MQVLQRRWRFNPETDSSPSEIVKVAVGKFSEPQDLGKSDLGAQVYWSRQPWIVWLLEHRVGDLEVKSYQQYHDMTVAKAIVVELLAEDATYMAMKWDV